MFCCAIDTPIKDVEHTEGGEAFYNVMVVGARGIRNSDWMPGTGKPDCYCEVRAMGEGASEKPLFVTKILDDTLEPMWRQEVSLPDLKKHQGLQFKVWDKDVIGSDYLGKVQLQAGHFGKEGFNGELPMEEAGDGIRAYLRFKIKPPNKPYPPPLSPKFDVEVERSSMEQTWGLVLDLQDDRHLFISDINEGPFKKYNDGQDNDDKKVNVGDFISAVNGTETLLLDELKKQLKATVTIKRGVDLTMIVEKGEASLESSFSKENVSDGGLVIKTIGEKGMMKAYNDQTEDPNMRFQVNDRVMSVNGKRGNTSELHRMIQHAQGTFQVSVIRCAPDPDGGTTTADRWGFYD